MKTFSFTFRTPFETVDVQNIEKLTIDTAWGKIQIFPQHASLIDHIPFGFVRYQHEDKEYVYFVRSGIVHIDNDKNEVDLHCLFADQSGKTLHTTVDSHLAWVKEQLANHAAGTRTIGAYEHAFLEKEGIALAQQLSRLEEK